MTFKKRVAGVGNAQLQGFRNQLYCTYSNCRQPPLSDWIQYHVKASNRTRARMARYRTSYAHPTEPYQLAVCSLTYCSENDLKIPSAMNERQPAFPKRCRASRHNTFVFGRATARTSTAFQIKLKENVRLGPCQSFQPPQCGCALAKEEAENSLAITESHEIQLILNYHVYRTTNSRVCFRIHKLCIYSCR